jgi:hypothetical protein
MSFAQEMKDFIGAYQTGSKINASRTDQDYKSALTDAQTKKTERDNDPETLKLEDDTARAKLDQVRSAISNSAAARGYTGIRTEMAREQLRQMKAAGNPMSDVDPSLAGAYGAAGANATPAVPAAPIQNTQLPDTINYAQGGAIPDGNDVEGDDDEDDAVAGPAVGGATDISARRRSGPSADTGEGLEGVVSPALVHDAVKAGYRYGARATGLGNGGIRTAAQKRAAQAYAQGAGGLNPHELAFMKKAVDPEGKLTESQRNMAAIGAAYQFYANRGEGDKAEKIAFQMLQSYRNASQRYAALAAHAAEQGNMDLATTAALKSYANVPDGRTMQLTYDKDNGRLVYHYTDEYGKTISKGVATPQELAASSMGLATGGFDKAILSAAGAREQAGNTGSAVGAPKGGGKPPKPADVKGMQELLDEQITGEQANWQKKNAGKEVDTNYWGDVRDAAHHIMQQNPNVTPREAVQMGATLLTPKGNDPTANGFNTTTDGAGNNVVTFGTGAKITLNDDQFDAVATQRAQRIKANQVTEQKAKDDAAASQGRWDRAKSAVSSIGGAIADDASQLGRQVLDKIPDETKARASSAIDQASRGDYPGAGLVRAATDPDTNFGTLATAYKKGVQDAASWVAEKIKSNSGGAIPGGAPPPATPEEMFNPTGPATD